ncbi:hypothetical protein M3Y96_00530200 [Aphelenchoides besseyi]|nr:hypothetical protein M3Y96_00530200 [Aphelenchoides besseyi]
MDVNVVKPTNQPNHSFRSLNSEFDDIVNPEQVEKTQRRIWGLFVMYFSHLTGLHPIRAPFFCNEEKCVKLSLYQRLSIFDIVMWAVNMSVCLNHFYLYFFCPGLLHLWLGSDSVALLKLAINSTFPFVVMLISLSNSAGLDHLLYLFSQVKREISASNNNQRIRRWRSLMFVLNALFMIAFMANILVILIHNLLEDEWKPQDKEQCKWCLQSILLQIDSAYFEIMSFGVSEVPRIFIMMMTIELGFLLCENTTIIDAKKKLTRERLLEFHEVVSQDCSLQSFQHFHKSTTILNELEATFNKLILFMVVSTVSIMTINSFVILQYLVNINGNETLISSIRNMRLNRYSANRERPEMCHLMILIDAVHFLLKMIWTVGFIVACVCCNEQSRSALPHLLDKLADDPEAKLIKDQLVQKLQDSSWGISMGKFMSMQRTVLLTMASVAFTVVVVWLQISTTKTVA